MKALSPSLGNYLLQINRLHGKQREVHVTDVALAMGVTKASVCKAARQLTLYGLLLHERYGPLLLTEAGRQHAVALSRKQASVQTFLTGVLGISEELAQKESRFLGHAVSEATAERMRLAAIRGVMV